MRRLILASLLLCGCIVQIPPRPLPDDTVPGPTPTPVVPVSKTTRADLCQMLAAHIEAKHIDTTEEMVRVLGIMKDVGNWTDADSEAVEKVLPDLTEKRALTDEDAAKLKSVK